VANLPLAFAELLGGGVLLTMGISGQSAQDVFAGTISLTPFDAGTAAGGEQATSADANAPQAPAGSPLARLGKIIGRPYQGTHTLFGNWESDNAVDLAAPIGTPVLAVADGTIGPQLGPLAGGDPHLAGNRLHLVAAGNEFYYAHLSRLAVHAGQHVKAGDVLGYSGQANGVAHLHFAQKTGNPLTWITKLLGGGK
jgi:murein DD-endopeptidase MepM/ murein hydrolase activator NlpD